MNHSNFNIWLQNCPPVLEDAGQYTAHSLHLLPAEESKSWPSRHLGLLEAAYSCLCGVQPWALRSHRINTALYLQRPIAQEHRVCFNVSLRQVPCAAAPRDSSSQGDTMPFPAPGLSCSAPKPAGLVLEEQEETWVPSSPSIPLSPALPLGQCCELKYSGFCCYGGTSGAGKSGSRTSFRRVTEPGFSFP